MCHCAAVNPHPGSALGSDRFWFLGVSSEQGELGKLCTGSCSSWAFCEREGVGCPVLAELPVCSSLSAGWQAVPTGFSNSLVASRPETHSFLCKKMRTLTLQFLECFLCVHFSFASGAGVSYHCSQAWISLLFSVSVYCISRISLEKEEKRLYIFLA